MDQSICPICHQSVPSFQLQRHANSHFEDEELARDMELAQQIALAPPSPPFINNPVKNDMPCETSAQQSHGSSTSRCDGRESSIDEKIYYLISLQIRASFYKVEAGLMALLRKCLELDSANSTSILSGYVDHFQSIESEDIGWGCGWRNIQMLSSHLLMQRQDVREVLFGGSGYVPDIASLQRWLEIAWERGFDMLGSSHFSHKIYGKKNWIGTTECAALFRSFGLRARIVDFDSKNIKTISSASGLRDGASGIKIYGPMDRYLSRGDPNIPQSGSSCKDKSSYSSICVANDMGTSICSDAVKRSLMGHQVLIDWVWNYFSDNKLTTLGNARVIVSEKAPLYFQHDGHSRTIVGIQVKHQHKGTQQYNLLILDPGHKTAALEKSLKENVGWQKLIKRGVHTLKKPQYQLCYIDLGIACGEEIEQLKTLDSVYVEF
ncbi:Zinc finger-containing ubiquitin peptidase 1 [Camellia lanceoleosa]|uniref:Zinc finger-containing ubiquitin peptidase 1 n=1 Tax=Camellia lanceoleosa TaxID=1840588 RepID=A0ACC0GZD3_9ERIC|nr:Zinc finger-containing ubiquitin peptidase 1 [Camellia lanceoleosa]